MLLFLEEVLTGLGLLVYTTYARTLHTYLTFNNLLFKDVLGGGKENFADSGHTIQQKQSVRTDEKKSKSLLYI